jgi:serine/threonine protein kinase
MSPKNRSARWTNRNRALQATLLDHTILGDSQELGTDHSLADVDAPAALASTVTYISSSGIGTQHKGRYRLDRILGEGAFGQVYLAFDEELQRQVAIKVPMKARFQKPDDAEAYLAEARTVASLDHPNIVAVYDVGRTDDGSIDTPPLPNSRMIRNSG